MWAHLPSQFVLLTTSWYAYHLDALGNQALSEGFLGSLEQGALPSARK